MCWICDDITASFRRNHRKLLSRVSDSRPVHNDVGNANRPMILAVQEFGFDCGCGGEGAAGLRWSLTELLTD